jgi:hypothetical protein
VSVRGLNNVIGSGTSLVLGLVLAAAPAAVPAQAPATAGEARSATEAESAAQPIEEVVVRGRRLSEVKADLRIEINAFLDAVAQPMRGRGYARWDREVCIGVHNLESTAAQYVIDRISMLALDVGLTPGGPGCRPDVNIIFANNAAEAAAHMVEREPRVFRLSAGFADTNLGLAELDDFVKADRPVRWWHVSLPVDARTGSAAIELPQTPRTCAGSHCPPMVSVAGPSRIHSGIVDELQYVIIVVDGTKLAGKTTWQQLGDYLAVVSLAQIDPKTDPAPFDSILNLFTNPAAYSGLTDWDRSYVRALYAFDQERDPQLQKNEIVSRIADRELGLDE